MNHNSLPLFFHVIDVNNSAESLSIKFY
jgi:hypothetical protein